MRIRFRFVQVLLPALFAAAGPVLASGFEAGQAAADPHIQVRVLATSKTSTMEKELNEAAEMGFRLTAVMGGETAIGGKEVVAVLSRTGTSQRVPVEILICEIRPEYADFCQFVRQSIEGAAA